MLNLQHRIDLLVQLGEHIENNPTEWQETKLRAQAANGWFTPEFIDLAANNIVRNFLQADQLAGFAQTYHVPDTPPDPRNVGIVMAGNIPLVGFHDWLCVFLSGHRATVKLSSKDDVLFKYLIRFLYQKEVTLQNLVSFADNLKGCDAYIATGSDNTARYFDYYFSKYPSIIRRNRSSVAILDGTESAKELELLADDTHQYFGLGCRNVTKLYVPKNYDFVPLLEAMKKYLHFFEHNKYKNNYDYQLAIHLLNNQFYMTNGSVLLVENPAIFSAIGQIHYEFYEDRKAVELNLEGNETVQCIVGHGQIPFGGAQCPGLGDFADGVDTMAFLQSL